MIESNASGAIGEETWEETVARARRDLEARQAEARRRNLERAQARQRQRELNDPFSPYNQKIAAGFVKAALAGKTLVWCDRTPGYGGIGFVE